MSIRMDKLNFRLQKASTDKLFYIDSETSEKSKLYKIMGSTGNIYDVVLTNSVTCNCPDFKYRHKRCKHIFFVMIKLLKLTDVNKDNYTDKEIKELINRKDITTGHVLNSELMVRYKKLKGGKVEIIECEPQTDDVCPVCLDDILNGEEYIHCRFSCGKCVHRECYDNWMIKRPEKNCIFCLKNMSKLNEGYADTDGDYVNLLGSK
jgi:hypothetical protein